MRKIKVGIVGCGAIGSNLAKFIEKLNKKRVVFYSICDLDKRKIKRLLPQLEGKPKIFDLEKTVKTCDLVIEAANINTAKEIINKALKFRKDLFILSTGVFIKYPHLLRKIEEKKINLYIPSGAIAGADGLSAVKYARIKRITLITSKSVDSLKEAPFFKDKKISLNKKRILFKGKLKEAIKYFPQNINVSSTIFLASCFKNVEVVIKLDPKLKYNVHKIEIISDKAKINISVENTPSKINPKTSYLAILSSQALLEKIISQIKIGS